MTAGIVGGLVPVGAGAGVRAVDGSAGAGFPECGVSLLDELECGRINRDCGGSGGDRHKIWNRQGVTVQSHLHGGSPNRIGTLTRYSLLREYE